MNKIQITLIAVIALAIAGVAIFMNRNENSEGAAAPNQTVSNEIDTEIRSFVSEFGTKLKNVSLLQPAADLKNSLQSNFGEYVAPELLTKWQADPKTALGRNVSSPWPDRIEIVEVVPESTDTYRVEGNIIELTSADKLMEPFGVQPVTLILKRSEVSWIITDAVKGAYSELPQRISVVGFWECLPYKNTSGPQTLECAQGIAIDQSDGHYAINTMLMSQSPIDFPSGTKVRVEGIMTPANQLSTDMWQKYDIDGIISATAIQRVQ